MHLIVPFAAPLCPSGRAALTTLATPQLDALSARWQPVRRDSDAETSLTPPHERALARQLGGSSAVNEAGATAWPWAAQQAAADGLTVGDHAWGLLTPAHWHVGSDGVQMADPSALELGAQDSRALFEALRPLFESEGFVMHWSAPLRWYAAHDSLRELATASLDRVVGRHIEPWLPRQPQARLIRRLQNEVQMLLHRLPLNAEREATGALAVNSFWLSGCGAARPAAAHDARLDERLRAPALRQDWAAWQQAWRDLDAEAIAPLQAAAARGEAVRLTLCGERGSVELAPRARPGWRRLLAPLTGARASARTLLEPL